MTVHIAIGTETLGTHRGAIVLSAAFVRFSDEAQVTLNLSASDQEALGLDKDESTLAWWRDYDAKTPGSWARATSNALPLATALPYIASWIDWARGGDDIRIWSKGTEFGSLLGEVYRRAGIACPWQYHQLRDIRTLCDLALIEPKDYAVLPPHVALNAAIEQRRVGNAALAILARAHHRDPVERHHVAEIAISNAETAAQLEIKDTTLRAALVDNIVAAF
ncbi:hypothetical protein AOQ73_05730 [Bradyrhizobium pachyrhizi]|uniref:3'-5' exoribonuclease domain-containing protein n=1 Tax=Bradyrhizobium pachyrhizi TaxID=280333 RepID=UPI000704B222|nr:3'-5' exoribonuclease [Bradyrhizobium pachyrhizi]KRQ11907.1 hypothetical protein AOQ73_05730 [Bradyrhizobium pachyrhizi]